MSLKDSLESGGHPLGTWLSIGHPPVAEALGQLPLDFVVVDMEHTTMALETVANLVRGVDAAPGDTDVVVRVPGNDPVQLKRIVDIGVAGVMVPMVDDPTEARALVRAIRYPPEGIRGIAGSRATGYGRHFEEYVSTANGSILTIAQIETEAGLSNAEAIGGVDGIDALFVGPADLSGSLGMFAEWNSPAFAEALEEIIESGHEAGVPVGTLSVDAGNLEQRLGQGFDFLIAGKDVTLLLEHLEDAMTRYDEALHPLTAED